MVNNEGRSPDDIPGAARRNRSAEGWPPQPRRDPPSSEQSGQPKKRHRRRKIILLSVSAVFLLTLIGGAAFAVIKYYSVYQFLRDSTGRPLPAVTTNNGLQPTQLPGDLSNVDHFNLLLLGSDNDPKFSGGVVLTQTDIVVRVDLAHKKITLVSIPRDLWLPSDTGDCCYKLDQISSNETDGASTPLERELHGFAHTAATIEDNFGIPIDAYAWVGLDGFVKLIDTLGGVDVDVLHPVVDDAYPKDLDPNGNPYAYQRLYIPAGPQHLDGEQALNYVRSRHSDLLGDFGRSQRQQSVLIALKKKLDDPAIFGKLDQLATDLQGSVLTSLSLGQIISLANFAKGLSSSDFHQYVLGVPTYGYYDQVDGQAVVQPIWSAINPTLRQIFS
jgi:LCP family protein required for cell wall assembly